MTVINLDLRRARRAGLVSLHPFLRAAVLHRLLSDTPRLPEPPPAPVLPWRTPAPWPGEGPKPRGEPPPDDAA